MSEASVQLMQSDSRWAPGQQLWCERIERVKRASAQVEKRLSFFKNVQQQQHEYTREFPYSSYKVDKRPPFFNSCPVVAQWLWHETLKI